MCNVISRSQLPGVHAHMLTSSSLSMSLTSSSFLLRENDMRNIVDFECWSFKVQLSPSPPSLESFLMSWQLSWCLGHLLDVMFLDVLVALLICMEAFFMFMMCLVSWLPSWCHATFIDVLAAFLMCLEAFLMAMTLMSCSPSSWFHVSVLMLLLLSSLSSSQHVCEL